MHAYLYPGLEKSPEVFASIIRQTPSDRLDVPTHPDRFTPRQVIAHLADWEAVLREERMRAPVLHPGCPVNAYDEGQRAVERNYDVLDVDAQLQLFAVERAGTIVFLKSLTPEQWKATMVHPERGVMTVEDLANMMVGHDMYHVHQLLTGLR